MKKNIKHHISKEGKKNRFLNKLILGYLTQSFEKFC